MNIATLTGLTIGQYTVKEQLGAGSMGVVYRAHQNTLVRDVAIKILSPVLATQEGYTDRFTREARTAASLEHAHIVPIYDYGTQDQLSFVVMRLLTGGALAQRIAQREKENLPLPSLTEVSKMLREIAGALDYAHSQGVIHRDIKPGNIMFDSHGSAFLVDFGIAKLMDNLGLTATGLAVGTPTHMSPEQWRGEPVMPASDQYALGVVVYELVAGRLPFDYDTAYALMNKHLNAAPISLRTLRPELPSDVSAVVEKALSKMSHDRFPTVTDFADAFDEAIQGVGERSTQFFTFPVRPIRLNADGELYTARSLSGIAPAPTDEKPKRQPTSDELRFVRLMVEKRVKKQREWHIHVALFVGINLLLWAIWAVTMFGEFPWPLFITLAWGAGFVAHTFDVMYETNVGDKIRDREMERELQRLNMNYVPGTLEDEKAKHEAIDRLAQEDEERHRAHIERHEEHRQRRRERRGS